jgi:hypothetical protein
MGAIMPHLGAMCDHTGAAFTIWKSYRAEGWDPGASVEVTRQGHIGLYSGALRATFGSTVAKERRCGACRRLVFLEFGDTFTVTVNLTQSQMVFYPATASRRSSRSRLSSTKARSDCHERS